MTPIEANRRAHARVRLNRLMRWMALVSALTVAAALAWLRHAYGPMTWAMLISVIAGVGLTMLVGTGLMLLGFYSAGSGHDEAAADPFEERR